MAKETFERAFPGKSSQEIFEAARKQIEAMAKRHSLQHDADAAKLEGKISRIGAKGLYRVQGDRLVLELEFGMLVPGPIRRRVADEIGVQLGQLFG